MTQPFYFGDADRKLFGIYHPASSPVRNPAGALLCYPMGQEYMRAHRAFLQLARLLAARGLHVLRFDYSGTGDSVGEMEASSLTRWRQDVVAAARELREGADVERLGIVGLRLGGTLALETAPECGADALVLWNPVVQGTRYLRSLIAQHGRWLSGSFAEIRNDEDRQEKEALGFPLPARLVASIEALDLTSLEAAPLAPTLLIDSEGSAPLQDLRGRLGALGARPDYRLVRSPPVWAKQEDELGNLAVPSELLAVLATWLSAALC